MTGGERPALISWVKAEDRWRIAVAGPDHLTRVWMASVPAGFAATYSTRDGRVLSGVGVTDAHVPVRNDAAEHLPWTVHLAATGSPSADGDSRRLLLLLV